MKQLSIIIPVYNVEKYIYFCLESIFRQKVNRRCYEIIIINDGSNDKSIEAINDFASSNDNIIIINQDNQGVAAARNNGIKKANGKYILMLDSDDLLMNNTLDKWLEIAITSDADLVLSNYLKLNDKEILELQNDSDRKIDMVEKTGKDLLIELDPHKCYVWRILYKRKFILDNNISFFPGITYEDIPFIHECLIYARKCIQISLITYIYRQGHESITFSFSEKKGRDFSSSIALTWELSKRKGLSPEVRKKIRNDVFVSFSVLISTISHCTKNFKERNRIADYLSIKTKDINFLYGRKQITTNYLWKIMPHIFIFVHYLYGKIFEDYLFPLFRSIYKRLIFQMR